MAKPSAIAMNAGMPIVLIVMRMCPPLFASLVGVGPATERHRPSRADDRIDAIRTSMRPDFLASPRQRHGAAPDECCDSAAHVICVLLVFLSQTLLSEERWCGKTGVSL